MAQRVAVIGGGPAGSACAIDLARQGVPVVLFERAPEREKPCGGGLTQKALDALSGLGQIDLPWRRIVRMRLVGPTGRRVDLNLNPPILVISRRLFDSALRRLARTAGAHLARGKVRHLKPCTAGGWRVDGQRFDIVVGAAGINDPLSRHLGRHCKGKQRCLAVGYTIPGRFSNHIVCRFFKDARGYAWWFPRSDHVNAGIELNDQDFDMRSALTMLDEFIGREMPDVDPRSGMRYAWYQPMPGKSVLHELPFNGSDWLLCGDAAGFVDHTTGEGIAYALQSGRMAAAAVLKGDPYTYTRQLRRSLIPELIKTDRLRNRFYHSGLLRWNIFVLAHSPSMRALAVDLAHGAHQYRSLKKIMLQRTPRILAELVGQVLKRPRRYHD